MMHVELSGERKNLSLQKWLRKHIKQLQSASPEIATGVSQENIATL